MAYLHLPSKDSDEMRKLTKAKLHALFTKKCNQYKAEVEQEHEEQRARDALLIEKLNHLVAAYGCDMNVYDGDKKPCCYSAEYFVPHENPLLAQIQHILLSHASGRNRHNPLTKMPQ